MQSRRSVKGARVVEPWLRGTLGEVAPAQRAVLHALELAGEDVRRWCLSLSAQEIEATVLGLPTVGFQLRHIARSLDRLMTYAEGLQLSHGQLDELAEEHTPVRDLAREFETGLAQAMERVRAISPSQLDLPRAVGRERLPTNVAGLLIHVAEHTQRHVGQAITTAKAVVALRQAESS